MKFFVTMQPYSLGGGWNGDVMEGGKELPIIIAPRTQVGQGRAQYVTAELMNLMQLAQETSLAYSWTAIYSSNTN